MDNNIETTNTLKTNNVEEIFKNIFSIKEILKDMRDGYLKIVFPLLFIRRIECLIEENKEKVLAEYNEDKNTHEEILFSISEYDFYNTNKYSLEKLLSESDHIFENLNHYVEGFSKNIRDTLAAFEFQTNVKKIKEDIFTIIEKFSSMDLSFENVSYEEMGAVWERLIHENIKNETQGNNLTPNDIVDLMVGLLLSASKDEVTKKGKSIDILDPTCGSGKLLIEMYKKIKDINPHAQISLFGQENHSFTFALAQANLLLRNYSSFSQLSQEDVLKKHAFSSESMTFVIMDPPLGENWKEIKKFVEEDYEMADSSRFKFGLPGVSDSQLLFLQHGISSLGYKKEGKAVVLSNSSLLYSGSISSSEAQIREHLFNNDLIEAIIKLPNDIHYKTGINAFLIVISKDKKVEKQGKVQLIDATNLVTKLTKVINEGKKSTIENHVDEIISIFENFAESKISKIVDNSEFIFQEYKTQGLIDGKKTTFVEVINSTEDVQHHFENNVLPYFEGATIDPKHKKTGANVKFAKFFLEDDAVEDSSEILNEFHKELEEINNLSESLKD